MEGYEVITSDEQKLGSVVEVKGENLIVERGLLRKTRHAIPKVFAEEDGAEQVVRLTVSEELVETRRRPKTARSTSKPSRGTMVLPRAIRRLRRWATESCGPTTRLARPRTTRFVRAW